MGSLATRKEANPRREPRLSEAVIEGMVSAARGGIPIETTCAMLGISPSTFHEWLQIGSGERATWHTGKQISEGMLERLTTLFGRMAAARAEREAEAVWNIREAGQTIGKSGVQEWRAEAWWLEHNPGTRERWGQHLQVNHTQELSPVHKLVRELSDDELLQLTVDVKALGQSGTGTP